MTVDFLKRIYILGGANDNRTESSGHLSVAAGGITPYINEKTIALTASRREVSEVSVANHDSFYYLKLWAKVLKLTRSKYEVLVDVHSNKVCFQNSFISSVPSIWFPIANADDVRALYINFRLCGDNFEIFLKHHGNKRFK